MKRLLSTACTSAMLVALVAAGCANTDDGPSVAGDVTSGDAASSDVGLGESDTAEAPSQPDRVVAAVEIAVEPATHMYIPDSTVETSATVINSDGETVDNPSSLEWSHSPSERAEMTGDGEFRLTEEGSLTIEACATLEAGQEICGNKKIVIDGSRPTIQIDTPQPGAMLGSPQPETITVKGRVTDSHGNLTAVLNDERLSLSDNGSFETEVDPTFGINTIHVVANDGYQRRDTTETLAVLWAPRYKKIGSNLTFSFTQGIGIDLGQNFFDDGEPPIRNDMESELVTKDFNDILELLLQNINLTDQLPDPVIDSGNTQLRVTSINLSETDMSMDVTDQGLAAYLHLGGVQMQTTGQAEIEGETLDLTGAVGARISATTAVSVNKPSGDASFEANVDDISLSLDELDPSFADDKANALFELAEGVLRSKLEERLVGAVREEIVDTLPEMLTGTLDSFESSLSDQTVTFSSEITGTREIELRGDIQTFETLFRQSMFGVISNEIETPGTDVHPNSRGIPMRTPSRGGIPLFRGGRIQLGARLGLLNGILTGLWKTGFLDVNLSDSLPDDLSGLVERAELTGQLPALLRPPRSTEPYDLVLETGQLEIETEALGQTDKYGLNVRAGIEISLEDGELALEVPDDPMLHSWLISTSGDSPQIGSEDLNKLILSKVWPRLEDTINGGLNIEMPVPNLSDLTDISPTLRNLDMDFVMERPLEVRGGYVVFDSTLQGTLPLGD